jgi:hypothetical protein
VPLLEEALIKGRKGLFPQNPPGLQSQVHYATGYRQHPDSSASNGFPAMFRTRRLDRLA